MKSCCRYQCVFFTPTMQTSPLCCKNVPGSNRDVILSSPSRIGCNQIKLLSLLYIIQSNSRTFFQSHMSYNRLKIANEREAAFESVSCKILENTRNTVANFSSATKVWFLIMFFKPIYIEGYVICTDNRRQSRRNDSETSSHYFIQIVKYTHFFR